MTKLELEKELRIVEGNLRRYCHASGCNFIYDCPALHSKCSQKLDLSTAIAWTVADCLGDTI